MESLLQVYETTPGVKEVPAVRSVVEQAIGILIRTCNARDEACANGGASGVERCAALEASVAETDEAYLTDQPRVGLLAVMSHIPDDAYLQGLAQAADTTAAAVLQASRMLRQQLRGNDVVSATMCSERNKAEMLLNRTSQELLASKKRVQAYASVRDASKRVMAARAAKQGVAVTAVHRAQDAVKAAFEALKAFDSTPVPRVSALVDLSAAVSDAKVLADLAEELVKECESTGRGGSAGGSSSGDRYRGVRVLQRARALIVDAGKHVKGCREMVAVLDAHQAFQIGMRDSALTTGGLAV